MSRKKERKPVLDKEETKHEQNLKEPTVEREKKERHEKKKRRKQEQLTVERTVSTGMLSTESNESAVELAIDPMRRLIAQELVDTERTYVNQLGSLINIFKQPLVDSNKLSEREIRLLFSSIEEILMLHTDLLGKITKSLEKPDFLIGNIFVDVFLGELKQGKYDLTGFFKEQQLKAGYDIQDLLILPVQRIPRYRLLLTSLLEHTHELHIDHALLKEAVKKTEEVADRINRSIKELLARQQAIDFHSKIKGKLTLTEDFLLPTRIFVSTHPLSLVDCVGMNVEKKDMKEKKVEVHIFNDICVITSPKGNEHEWINHAYLHHSMLKKSFGENASPLVFQYVNPVNCFVFRAESEEQRDTFISAIKTACQQLLETRPTLAAERKLIKLSQNEESGLWDAIKMAPRFADRITVEQLQAESEIETKKALALDELMDFYSTVAPLDTPRTPNLSKRGTKFNLLSTLSPLKSAKKARKPISILNAGSVDDHNVVPSSPTATPSKDLMKERRKSMVDRVSNIENETNSPLQNASLRKEVTNSPKDIKRKRLDLDDTPVKKTKLFDSPKATAFLQLSPRSSPLVSADKKKFVV